MLRIFTVLGMLASLTLAVIAEARTETTIQYTKTQVYSAALRYLRVDLGFPVTERDSDAAYLLFEHPAQVRGEAAVRGAIELVETPRGLRLFISVPQLPAYQEDVFKRGLLSKLQGELGKPVTKSKAPTKPGSEGQDKAK